MDYDAITDMISDVFSDLQGEIENQMDDFKLRVIEQLDLAKHQAYGLIEEEDDES